MLKLPGTCGKLRSMQDISAWWAAEQWKRQIANCPTSCRMRITILCSTVETKFTDQHRGFQVMFLNDQGQGVHQSQGHWMGLARVNWFLKEAICGFHTEQQRSSV